MHHDCCGAQRRGRAPSQEGVWELEECVRSWDEDSRKRRRHLAVGGEGEDSGCQIRSLRLWKMKHLYTMYTETHTSKVNMKPYCVRGRGEDLLFSQKAVSG